MLSHPVEGRNISDARVRVRSRWKFVFLQVEIKGICYRWKFIYPPVERRGRSREKEYVAGGNQSRPTGREIGEVESKGIYRRWELVYPPVERRGRSREKEYATGGN